MMRIAIVAALPQEYRQFQKLTRDWAVISKQPLRVFHRHSADKECFLVETGMGKQHLEAALHNALPLESLDLILSTGFAGSLWEGFAVGQVVLATGFTFWGSTRPAAPSTSLRFEPSARLARFCRQHDIQEAQMVTVERPQPKMQLSRRMGHIPAVVDMESALVAHLAWRQGIPCVCLRAVSDGLRDEIDLDLDLIADSRGRIRLARVLLAMLEKPSLMGSFWHLWRHANRAARQLAWVLAALLTLSAGSLSVLVRESRLVPEPEAGEPPRTNEENPSSGGE
jgi:nucleoside phosphorylase